MGHCVGHKQTAPQRFALAYSLTDGIPSSRRTEACLSARRTRTAIGRGITTGSLLRSLRPASQPRTVRSETSKTRANSAPDRPKALRAAEVLRWSYGYGPLAILVWMTKCRPMFRFERCLSSGVAQKKAGARPAFFQMYPLASIHTAKAIASAISMTAPQSRTCPLSPCGLWATAPRRLRAHRDGASRARRR